MDGKKNHKYLKHNFISCLNNVSNDDYSNFYKLGQDDTFNEIAGCGDFAWDLYLNNSANKRSTRNRRRLEDTQLQRNNSGKTSQKQSKKKGEKEPEEQRGKNAKPNTEKRKAIIAPKKEKHEPVVKNKLSIRERRVLEKKTRKEEREKAAAALNEKPSKPSKASLTKAPKAPEIDTRGPSGSSLRKSDAESIGNPIPGPSGSRLQNEDEESSDSSVMQRDSSLSKTSPSSKESESSETSPSSESPKASELETIEELSENQEPTAERIKDDDKDEDEEKEEKEEEKENDEEEEEEEKNDEEEEEEKESDFPEEVEEEETAEEVEEDTEEEVEKEIDGIEKVEKKGDDEEEESTLRESSTFEDTATTSGVPVVEDAILSSEVTTLEPDVFEDKDYAPDLQIPDISDLMKTRSWSRDVGFDQRQLQRRGFADTEDERDSDVLEELKKQKRFKDECAQFWDALNVNVRKGPSLFKFYDAKLKKKNRLKRLSDTVEDYPVSNKAFWDEETRIGKNLARFSRDIASSALTRRESAREVVESVLPRMRFTSSKFEDKLRTPKFWQGQKNLLKYNKEERRTEKGVNPKDPFFYDRKYKESFADKDDYAWKASYWKKQKKFQNECKKFWTKLKGKFPNIRRRSLTDALRLQPDLKEEKEDYYKKHNLAGLKEQWRLKYVKRFEDEPPPKALKTEIDLLLSPKRPDKYKIKRFSEDLENVAYESRDLDYWKKLLVEVRKALYEINLRVFKRNKDLKDQHTVLFLDTESKKPMTKKEFESRRHSLDLDIDESLREEEKTIREWQNIFKTLKRLIRQKSHRTMQANAKQELIMKELDRLTKTESGKRITVDNMQEELKKIEHMLEKELQAIDALKCPDSTPSKRGLLTRPLAYSPKHKSYLSEDSPEIVAQKMEETVEPEWPVIEEPYTVDPSEISESDRHWCYLTENDLRLEPPEIIYPSLSQDWSSPSALSSPGLEGERVLSGSEDPFSPSPPRGYCSDDSLFSDVVEEAEQIQDVEVVEPEPICMICERPRLNKTFALVGHVVPTNIMGHSNIKKCDVLKTSVASSYDEMFNLLKKQVSKILKAPPPTKWYNNVIVKTCGHSVHYDCYFNSIRSKVFIEEFNCGFCQEMMNCVIPLKAEESSSLFELDYNVVNQALRRFPKEKIDECDDHFKSALMKRKKIKEITYHVYVDVLRNNIEIFLMNLSATAKFDYKKFIPLKTLFTFCGKFVRQYSAKQVLVYIPNMNPAEKLVKGDNKMNLAVTDIKQLLLTTLLFSRDTSRSLVRSVICFYYNMYILQAMSWYIACLNKKDVVLLRALVPKDEPMLRFIIVYLAEKFSFISDDWKKEEMGQRVWKRFLEGIRLQNLLYLKFCVAVYCSIVPGTEDIFESIEQMKAEELLEVLFGGEEYYNPKEKFINIYQWKSRKIDDYLDKYVLDFKYLKNFKKMKLKKINESEEKSKVNPFKKVSSFFLSIFKIPSLLVLPPTLAELKEHKNYNMTISQKIICLVCMKYLPKDSSGKIQKHVDSCGKGTCALLDVDNLIIYLHWNYKPIKWKKIYVAGQSSNLELNSKKYKALETIWQLDAFDLFLKKSPMEFYH